MPKSRTDFAALAEPVARALLGEPNTRLSKPHELRYGTHGSLSVNLKDGTFFDHEAVIGGGVLDLIEHRTGCNRTDAVLWLKERGLIDPPRTERSTASTVTELPKVVAEYDYTDEFGALLHQVVRYEPKTFRQRRPDCENPGRWINNVDGVAIVPYRLPELIEAVGNDQPILIVEGEAKVDLLRSWNVAATCCSGGSGKWKHEHSEFLDGADVMLLPDADDAGYRHVEQVGASLNGVAKRIRVVLLPNLPPKGDVVDWAEAGGTREKLDELIEGTPEWKPKEPEERAKAASREDDLIARLTELKDAGGGLEFARKRKEAANELSVSVGDVDAEIQRRRDEKAAPLYGHWIVEPADEPAEGDTLLRDIIRRIKRHVVCTSDDALAIALWVVFAWVHDEAATHSPILLITSAEPESGKSTTLSIIAHLAPRAIASVEISTAGLYRSIERWQPSFVIDEFDSVLSNDDKAELRSIINSGHIRGQGVIRCIGDDKTPSLFVTFSPKCIGMIGRKLPAATLSRSIGVELRRRKLEDKVEQFDHRDDSELSDLRRRLRRFSMDNADALKAAKPNMPECFVNRRADNWRLLFAIADLSGEEWGDKARETALRLTAANDASTINVRVLAAIKAIIEKLAEEKVIGSAELVKRLTAIEDGEWAEYRNGKEITQRQLAELLKPFRIFPDKIRTSTDGTQIRGYRLADFADAFERYL